MPGDPSREQFEVEVADLSTTAVAFVSDRTFHSGDLVALMPTVDGQPIPCASACFAPTASTTRWRGSGARSTL